MDAERGTTVSLLLDDPSVECWQSRDDTSLPCQKREIETSNFCQNRRTFFAREYQICCAAAYFDLATKLPVCVMQGLPENYPGGCEQYVADYVAKLNTFSEVAGPAALHQ